MVRRVDLPLDEGLSSSPLGRVVVLHPEAKGILHGPGKREREAAYKETTRCSGSLPVPVLADYQYRFWLTANTHSGWLPIPILADCQYPFWLATNTHSGWLPMCTNAAGWAPVKALDTALRLGMTRPAVHQLATWPQLRDLADNLAEHLLIDQPPFDRLCAGVHGREGSELTTVVRLQESRHAKRGED